MKVNSINSTANYDNKVAKNNRNANTNFKGLADLPGVIMQGIENGGFAASFIIQDTLGMTVPRTWEGLHRGIEKPKDPNAKKEPFFTRVKNGWKNFNLKAMNLKEGAEVFLREALSGPILMFTPMLVLLGAKKFVGKSTFTNSTLINRLGNQLKSTVKDGAHNTAKDLRTAFYKNSVKEAVSRTTNVADKTVENGFVEKMTNEILKLDTLTEKKAAKKQQAKIVEMFNNYHTSNSNDYSMVNKLKFDGQTYSTGSFVDGLRGFADDVLKNKQVSDVTEEFAESFTKSSIIKRGITNIAAALSTIGAVSIVPKLYSLINPVPPGAIENNSVSKENAVKPTVANAQPQDAKNGNKVSFTGKWDSLARHLEFNGNNFTPVLMTVLATGGLLGPRIKVACDRAPENPITKKKDYSEVPEILTRDLISTGAVTFGVPMISKALVSSYENASGYVLQNHPEKKISGIKKALDFINPLSGINPYNLNDLNAIYGKVDSVEKLGTFSDYINKNNGSLAKIFNTMDNGKSVFEAHGLNIKDLATHTDRKAANKVIMDKAAASEEFANKLIELLKPDAKGRANKIVKRARTLNSITSFAATVALVPAFLGIILPKIVYAQTAKRQQKNAEEIARIQQEQGIQVAQVSEEATKVDFSKLKKNNATVFKQMKHQ